MLNPVPALINGKMGLNLMEGDILAGTCEPSKLNDEPVWKVRSKGYVFYTAMLDTEATTQNIQLFIDNPDALGSPEVEELKQ